MKLLSVIIPMYNSARWLEKCLYSVLEQDVPDEQLEVICINDGSPDESAAIARAISKKHPCVKVLEQANQGTAGARNTGMQAATGKYLCFVDPDDYVEPNVFGQLVQQMETERLDVLRFDYRKVDGAYQMVEKRAFEKRFDYTSRLMSGAEFIATRLDIACNIWRYTYRTTLITKNALWCFPEQYYDDTPWLPLVLLHAERMNTCSTIVYNYMERSDSLVMSKNPMMMRRKTDGAMLLLQTLERELADIYANRLSVANEWKEGVKAWYKMVEAHTAVSLLTDVAISQYAERQTYLHRLQKMKLFPLSARQADEKTLRKIRLANINPRLLMWFVHWKNSR